MKNEKMSFGRRLVNLDYSMLSGEELGEVYLHCVVNYGRNHVRTSLVRDELNNRFRLDEMESKLYDKIYNVIREEIKEDIISEIEFMR